MAEDWLQELIQGGRSSSAIPEQPKTPEEFEKRMKEEKWENWEKITKDEKAIPPEWEKLYDPRQKVWWGRPRPSQEIPTS